MEGNGGSSSGVVPEASAAGGLLMPGSQTTPSESSANRLSANLQGMDPAEKLFRANVERMLDETMGPSQCGGTEVLHSKNVEWLGGVPGMRLLML